MIDKVLVAGGWFISGWIGAFLGYLYAVRLARRQKAAADAGAREAYLQHLPEEFTANRRILWEMRTYIDGGPAIPEILEPSVVAATHLRFTAWDALIRAGVLASLPPNEQALFRVADRAGRKAAQAVQTLAATWHRFLVWQAWTHKEREKGELVQLMPADGMLRQVQRNITESLTYALARTDQALARLRELLPTDSESPAS